MPSYNNYSPYYSTQPNVYPSQMNVGSSPMNVGTQTQIQDGGFVSIPNEEMVYSYPVGMGKCVTFKVEGKPIILEKAMGFSQFEAPKIRRFRLVEEEAEKEKDGSADISDMEKVKSDIREIWGKLDEIENSRKRNQPQQKNDRNGEH